jgi:MFS family permease
MRPDGHRSTESSPTGFGVGTAAAGRFARNPALLAAIRFLFFLHFVSSVLIPFLRDWGGLSYLEILFLNAWFMAWSFLLEVPTGVVADRFGRRISVALAGAAASAAALVLAAAPRYPLFLLGEVLFAASTALLSGADEALLYDSLRALGREDRATRSIAQLEAWKLAGIVSGALAGGPLAAQLGLRAPLLAQAAPAALAALLALALVEPAHAEAAPRPGSRELLLGSLRHLREHPVLRALALDLVACASLAWLVIWLYQPQLERVGIPLAFFGTVHAGMCLGQIALLGGAARFERLLGGRRRLVRLAAWLPGLAYLVLAVASSAVTVVVAIVLLASFGLSRPVLFSGALHRHIPSLQRATVLSSISMLRTLAIALVNPLVGLVADRSMQGALLGLGVAALGVALLTRRWEQPLEDAG